MKNPRLFLAAYAALDDYVHIRSDFETLIRGRWTPQQQLHATVVFFGQNYAAGELLELLKEIDFSAEASQINALGFFKRNNILYAQTDNPSLQRLCRDVTAALKLPPSHFIPHITLMRIKEILDQHAFDDRLKAYQNRPLGELTNRIALFSSELSREGAKYTLIKEWT